MYNEPTNNYLNTARFAALRHFGGMAMGLGVALIILGSFAVATSAFTTLMTMLVLGVLLIAGGIIQSVQALWAPHWHGFFAYLVTGIFELILGVLLIAHPAIGAATLTIIFALLFLVSGTFRFIMAPLLKFEHWGWHMIAGLISIVLGIMLLTHWPASGIWFVGLLVGINMIISGWTLFLYSLCCKEKVAEAHKRFHREHAQE